MSYAFSKKLPPKPFKKLSSPQMPAKAFHEDMRTLMRSLAIGDTGNIKIILKNPEVIRICEEYANAGIQELYFLIKNKSSDVTSEQVLDDIITSCQNARNPN